MPSILYAAEKRYIIYIDNINLRMILEWINLITLFSERYYYSVYNASKRSIHFGGVLLESATIETRFSRWKFHANFAAAKRKIPQNPKYTVTRFSFCIKTAPAELNRIHPELPVQLCCSASPTSIAGILSQTINGEERPIAFASHALTKPSRIMHKLIERL